jgi:hypothetical protein
MCRALFLASLVALVSCTDEPSAPTKKFTTQVTIEQKATTEQIAEFHKLLGAAAFDSVDPRVEGLALAIVVTDSTEEVRIYSFNKALTSNEVESAIYQDGHIPGSVRHLLLYAASYRDEQRSSPITGKDPIF